MPRTRTIRRRGRLTVMRSGSTALSCDDSAWKIIVASLGDLPLFFFLMTDQIVVLCTCASTEDAERLARALVTGRLAACVSLVPGLRSFYRWKGEIESAEECLLLIKSSRARFDALREAIEKLHSYAVPQVL